MNLKVVIVDDEEHILEELTYILSKCDYVKIVGACTSGEDALKTIIEYSPDVVILDIEMPKSNGIELAKFLKKKRYIPLYYLFNCI